MTNPVENMVEVTLPSDTEDGKRADFLKIMETLTRIGIASRKENKLYQSAHILHKQGRYYICHFKEMFLLDGREATLTEEDKVRRDIIASRLEEWGLVSIVDKEKINNEGKTAYIKVLPYKEKENWELVSKYNIGKHRK
jgi:Bacteriophage translational regulator